MKKQQQTSDSKMTEIMKKLQEVKGEGIKKEVVGSWIWITGDTYEHRDLLKSLGFKWASKKKAWYYTEDKRRRYGKREYNMEEIKSKYGSQTL